MALPSAFRLAPQQPCPLPPALLLLGGVCSALRRVQPNRAPSHSSSQHLRRERIPHRSYFPNKARTEAIL